MHCVIKENNKNIIYYISILNKCHAVHYSLTPRAHSTLKERRTSTIILWSQPHLEDYMFSKIWKVPVAHGFVVSITQDAKDSTYVDRCYLWTYIKIANLHVQKNCQVASGPKDRPAYSTHSFILWAPGDTALHW